MKSSSNSTGTPGGVLQTDAQEVASVVSAREIQAVAELLQVSPEGLQKAITFKVTVSPWWLGPLHAPCCVGPLPLSPASHSCPSLGCAQSWVPQTPKARRGGEWASSLHSALQKGGQAKKGQEPEPLTSVAEGCRRAPSKNQTPGPLGRFSPFLSSQRSPSNHC